MATTGTYAIPLSFLIDRELVVQTGESLRAWCERRGVPYDPFVARLNRGGEDLDGVLADLADELGVSRASLAA